MNISVIGLGYVGVGNAILLSKYNNVVAYDTNVDKIGLINNKKSPIKDSLISRTLEKGALNLVATNDIHEALCGSDLIIIATPTDYDSTKNAFNVKSIDDSMTAIMHIQPFATVVVKSTIPVDYVQSLRKKYKKEQIYYSPEFLREGMALYDNLYPSRIIIGGKDEAAVAYTELMKEACDKKDVQVIFCDSNEAEAIKLFSNAYLAMRVAFFNELDTFSEINNLDTVKLLQGVCSDNRIGNYYNNPSFGYGGYCLPKDTKHLLAEYENVPNEIIDSIVQSNVTRKHYIAAQVIKRNPQVVGVYSLAMKASSDNFRQAAILDIIDKLLESNIKVIIYDPFLVNKSFKACYVERDFQKFGYESEIILANRYDKELQPFKEKVYTRDVFGEE